MSGSVRNIFKKLNDLRQKNPPLSEVISDFRVLAWGLSYLLFIIALIPTGSAFGKIKWIDKILHAVGFYFLLLFYIEGYGKKNRCKFFLFVLSLGFTMELLQGILPWRKADILDFGFDTIGAFLALITPLRLSSFILFLIGTFGGIGKLPLVPATIASCITLFLYWISPFGNDFLSIFIPILFFMGVYIAQRMSEKREIDDPKEIVIDEMVGVLIAVFLHPKTFETLLIGFILFRFFDIAKPSFVGKMEKLPGGLGIMMDDVMAGILASIGLFFLTMVDKLFPLMLF